MASDLPSKQELLDAFERGAREGAPAEANAKILELRGYVAKLLDILDRETTPYRAPHDAFVIDQIRGRT